MRKLFYFFIVLILIFTACDFSKKESKRETIFDKVVNIPKELILDIPKLPPYCDEIKDLKKGYIDIFKGKLYYEEEGQGVPLVLINGGPGGTHHGFHPYFSKIKDFARVIYYDQRGTGKSSADSTGKTYTVKQAVEDLESLRKALKIEKWAVLGFSYGGLLAQCYSLTYPGNCLGMILVAANTGFAFNNNYDLKNKIISPEETKTIAKIDKLAQEGFFQSDAQVIYNKKIVGDWKYYNYFKPTNEALIRGALYNWKPTPGFEGKIRPDSYKIGLQGKFDNFKIPTLILEAKWDLQWLEAGRVDIMRKNHPGAKIEVFEKSGHYIFSDEPEKFFDILEKFLKNIKY